MDTMLRIADIEPESISDGPGFRYVIFTQGCFRNCPGCHNPGTHDPKGGHDMTFADILKEIGENPLLEGVTFSGGEPFLQAEKLLPLARTLKEKGMSLMAYSGYTFEELYAEATPGSRELLETLDILVDGPYIEAERSLELLFRGSKNQRAIDVRKSLAEGRIRLAFGEDEKKPRPRLAP